MIATIDQNGVLTVQAETPLEAFALSRWAEEYRPEYQQETALPGSVTRADLPRQSLLLIKASVPTAGEST